jgi:hypothetical protein
MYPQPLKSSVLPLVVELEEAGHVYEVQRPVYYTSKVLFGYKTHYN